MGSDEDRKNFVLAVKKACRIAKVLNEHGVRKYGVIRIDSADSPAHWAARTRRATPRRSPRPSAKRPRSPPTTASASPPKAKSAGPACTRGRTCSTLLEEVGMPETVGFQADHGPHLSLPDGLQRPEQHALLKEGYSDAEFWAAYTKMTDALRPWTIDFHVAQNDGTVHGTGSHDKTGRHCPADDPNGKLDIVPSAPATGSRTPQPAA
jgi:hypothetical protein